jgi:hypothetical protein
VLDDLELAVLALGHDVLGHQKPIGDLLGDGLHHGVVGADGIRGHHVDVGESQGLRAGLAPGDEHFLVIGRYRLGLDGH